MVGKCSKRARRAAPATLSPCAALVVKQREACDVLKRASAQFPITLRVRDVYAAIAQIAAFLNLAMPKPRLRKATTACPFAVHDACIDFAYAPTPENLLTAVSSLQRFDLTILALNDSTPARLISRTVKPPVPPAPQVHRAPQGALDWVTNGAPKEPEHYATESQTSARIAARDERIARKGQLPTFRLLEVIKRANSVSKPVKWNARMGKGVLSLKK